VVNVPVFGVVRGDLFASPREIAIASNDVHPNHIWLRPRPELVGPDLRVLRIEKITLSSQLQGLVECEIATKNEECGIAIASSVNGQMDYTDRSVRGYVLVVAVGSDGRTRNISIPVEVILAHAAK
jgi:hypothetical protein